MSKVPLINSLFRRGSVLFLFVLTALSLGDAFAENPRRIRLDTLIDLEKIESIRLVTVPESHSVRVALTPERLLANFTQTLELKATDDRWHGFLQAVRRTTVERGPDRGDHRWAILFRDSGGRTKNTLAIDRRQRVANLNGQVYSIHGDLLGWLKGQTKLLINRE